MTKENLTPAQQKVRAKLELLREGIEEQVKHKLKLSPDHIVTAGRFQIEIGLENPEKKGRILFGSGFEITARESFELKEMEYKMNVRATGSFIPTNEEDFITVNLMNNVKKCIDNWDMIITYFETYLNNYEEIVQKHKENNYGA